MQDEEMDHMDELIREASNNHHPVYDDKAWEKMEALLDKHLPLKKDRRSAAVFFLLLLLITGAVIFTILYLPWQHKGIHPEENKPADLYLQGKTSNSQPGNLQPPAKTPSAAENATKAFLQNEPEKPASENFKGTSLNGKRFTSNKQIKTSAPGVINDLGNEKDITIDEDELTKKALPGEDEHIIDHNKASLPDWLKDQPVNTAIPGTKNGSAGIVAIKGTALPVPASGKLPARTNVKKSFANNFAVNLSAGPDRSFVEVGGGSKTRLNYGVGLSYTFADRFTLRSGFYNARKVYTAKSTDYHPPSWYWTNTADLKSVNADCSIYEIPLAVSYNFGKSNNHNWFAGVGFSTFIMKRETYHYYYKDAWGQSRNKTWTLLNGGNNYFSVMTISGGFQYSVSPNFSILAEPYLKLPLSGIGFGKIKLNSGGILFTAGIKPFAKRK